MWRRLTLVLALAWAGAAPARPMTADEVTVVAASVPTRIESYGPSPLEYGELRVPKGRGPFPVAVVIHGGCWSRDFRLGYMRPLAIALTRQGVATWTIEYRAVGDAGGGWPGTFLDWAAAADHLRDLARTYPLDLTRVVSVGHSAGGHAALWLAARAGLPAASPIRGATPLKIAAAVDIDGPADLAAFTAKDTQICGWPATVGLMGGAPGQVPVRYAQASPIARLTLHTPLHLVAAQVLTPADAETYRRAASARGDAVQVLALPRASHGDVVDPTNAAGVRVVAMILRASGVGPR